LLADHERLYRTKYAPKSLVDDIEARVARARNRTHFRPRTTIATEARRVQLSLL
jgi:hypothetical protein